MDIPVSAPLQALAAAVTERFGTGNHLTVGTVDHPVHAPIVGATTATATTDGRVEFDILVINDQRGASHYSLTITERIDRT